MLRISLVSYLNSKPFLYGFRKTGLDRKAEIELDIPSVCADKLINRKVDIGLVPVAVLPLLSHYSIISDYCIGADGPVDSVLLLSDVPLEEIKEIALDYQSRTSVQLTRVLAKNFWKINPQFVVAQPGYENEISGNSAGVVIGDRALIQRDKFKFVYDLSGEWKKFTGLPFVFATWTAFEKPDDVFIKEFNEAIAEGMTMISEISENEKSNEISKEEIFNYLTNSIDFRFDDRKKEALKMFLKLAGELNQ